MTRLFIPVVLAGLLAWPTVADAQGGRPQRRGQTERPERGDRGHDRGIRVQPIPPGQNPRGPGQHIDRRGPDRGVTPPRGRRAFRGRAVVTAFSPRSGPPGTAITIHGQRFGPGVALVFGGQPIAPTLVTPTAITFAVPARAQGGVILLRQPNRPDLVVGSFEVGRAVARRSHPRRGDFRDVARRRWTERRAQLAATEAARLEALRAQEEALRNSRAERRRQRLAAMRAELEQDFLSQPATKDELSLHAERMARLERMGRLAEARLQEGLGVRIGILVQREERRHQQRMNDLRAAFAASR